MKNRLQSYILAIVLLCATLSACAKTVAPLSAEEFLDLGEKYLLELNYEQAVVQFTKLIEIEPMNLRGYTGAAEAYVGLGEAENAIAILRQGMSMMPDNSELASLLSRLESAATPETSTDWVPDITLTDGQLDILKPLEAALLSYDMNTAFPILSATAFQEICHSLPKENGNAYKKDSHGEWALAYFPQTDVEGANFQIYLVTDWNDGHIYLAESYLRDGKIDGGSMCTIDTVNGQVLDDDSYNWIRVSGNEN
jgi:tetratricopeptide (TPR) repeat protein